MTDEATTDRRQGARGGGTPPADAARARFVDYLFLLRPTALLPAWVFVVRGASLAASGEAAVTFLPAPGTGLALAAVSAALGGGYILNQITDIETDRRNDKLFLLPRGIITVPAARGLMLALWAAALLMALWLPPAARWSLAAALFLAVTYSAPRVRAKAVPGLDLLWNGLGFGAVSTALGWYAGGGGAEFPTATVAGYALAVAGLIASTTIPDVEGDRAEGLRTTGVVLGRGATSLLAVLLMAGAAALGLLGRDAAGAAAAAVGFALLLNAHLRGTRQARILASQGTVVAYALAAGLTAPYLLVLMVAVALGARVYYRRRFGIAYPGRGTP